MPGYRNEHTLLKTKWLVIQTNIICKKVYFRKLASCFYSDHIETPAAEPDLSGEVLLSVIRQTRLYCKGPFLFCSLSKITEGFALQNAK